MENNYMVPVIFTYDDYEFLKRHLESAKSTSIEMAEGVEQLMAIEHTGDLLPERELKQRAAESYMLVKELARIGDKYFSE